MPIGNLIFCSTPQGNIKADTCTCNWNASGHSLEDDAQNCLSNLATLMTNVSLNENYQNGGNISS